MCLTGCLWFVFRGTVITSSWRERQMLNISHFISLMKSYSEAEVKANCLSSLENHTIMANTPFVSSVGSPSPFSLTARTRTWYLICSWSPTTVKAVQETGILVAFLHVLASPWWAHLLGMEESTLEKRRSLWNQIHSGSSLGRELLQGKIKFVYCWINQIFRYRNKRNINSTYVKWITQFFF